MTTLTVEATDHVAAVYVELPYGKPGNIQGTVQVLLTAPEGSTLTEGDNAPKSSVLGTATTVRQIADLPAEIQTAIDTLTSAVTGWMAEDKKPPVQPAVDPEPEGEAA